MITHRLADLAALRSARRASARDIFNRLLLEQFYVTNPRELEEVVRAAQHEEFVYEHLLGEPMPRQLRSALLAEVRAWEAFYDVLVRPPVPEEDYGVLCSRLRPRALALMDLLDVEIEMLTNPLVRYYERWLQNYAESSR